MTPPSERNGPWARIGGALVLAGLALAIYWPALNGGWLWDDQENLADSPLAKAAHPWQLIWSGRAMLDYYPIKNSLQWVQWQLWGDHPLGYHVSNLVLHVLSAWLLWRLLERLGLRSRWAWVGGLLFVVHPVAVGSVAWVSEFKDTLSLPPLLMAALCYVDYDRWWGALSPTRFAALVRSRPLWLALGWFVIAMLSKSSVMMFPVCLLLYGWWARRPLRGVLLSALPFFVISGVCGVVAVEFQHHRAIAADGTGLGDWAFRLSLAGRAFDFYLAHALWPHDLAPVYLRWAVGSYLGWIPIAVLGALLLWSKDRWSRTAALGLGWFALHLLPVVGFVGIAYMRFSWVMDHLAYPSLIGLAGLAAAGLQALSDLPARSSRWLAGGLAAIAAAGLTAEARAYSPAYAGAEALWTYTTIHQPRHWMGFDNLAVIRIGQGRLKEAEALLRQALALEPSAPDSHLNLAVVENQFNQPELAEAEARRALQLRPDFAPAELELATYLDEQHKLAESVPHWQAVLRLVPPSADLHNRYALVLLLLGQYDAGVGELKQALAIDPTWGAAEFSWGSVLTQQGKPQEALPHYLRAAQLLPNDPVVQRQAESARRQAIAP